ncbi:MAG: NADP-dependent oxidoreductase, partial [Pseudomonadota bacterium]
MTETMKRIALASRPVGEPKPENFRLEEQPVPKPGPGQFVARTVWLSLDPYQRGRMDDAKSYAEPVPIDGTMEGGTVSEVVDSQNPDFKPGDIVVGRLGWATHGVSDGSDVRKVDPDLAPISTALGVLGMPGHTAYAGLNAIMEIEAGKTLCVSAASGAVGSLAVQLGKLKGLKVIGVAGGKEKCDYVVNELGADACLDHRAVSSGKEMAKMIAEAAPQGLDYYFENVAGVTLEGVIPNMNQFSRIAVCGMISLYSGNTMGDQNQLPWMWRSILVKRLRVQGFLVFDHQDLLPTFLKEVGPLVKDGTIKYRETVNEGLESAPDAFVQLLRGGNFGKMLVRVGADPA